MARILMLDTSSTRFLTDADGTVALDENQKPIAVATDFITGNDYQKVVECVSDGDPKKLAAKQKALADAGAIHYVSDVPGFTGWWAPVAPAPAPTPATT